MNNDEFDALVRLIEMLIGLHAGGQGHYADRPRQEALARHKADAIEEARRELVL